MRAPTTVPDETVGDPPDVTYERSLPIAKALHPDTMLAYEMNGEPLPLNHGYPLRLLVPGWYGMNSVKWLVGIHVLDQKFDGFYQTERYMTQNGPDNPEYYTYYTKMKVKSIITNPAPGEIIPAGGYTLAGAAWSGEEEVVKVEISADGGRDVGPGNPGAPGQFLRLVPVAVPVAAQGNGPLHPDVPRHEQPGRDPANGVPQPVGRTRLREQHGLPGGGRSKVSVQSA